MRLLHMNSRSTSRLLSVVSTVVALLALASASARGQTALGEGRRQAQRTELERAATATEQAALVSTDPKTRARLIAEAAAIRQRLRNGDFLPGDRIYLVVVGDSALTDTFTVRGDRRLPLPNIPEDISLAGVLDAELSSHLSTALSRYFKSPSVTASAMVRLTMTGGLGKNGFQTFPTDQAITDVIMISGGFSSAARFDQTEVRRSGKVIINKQEFQEAIRAGRTVGDLALRDGDEIYMPVTSATGGRTQGMMRVLAVAGPLFWVVRMIVRNNTTP